ncbi:hypothetical protein N7494_005936 [Penicillium frequentans]|uniref:DUF4470 domain-containing protein n=1 Tax=Penicillium frequentans TaxID=3151616 RepID=A0AAD6CVB2_9EURO|nr:hypothetical protein N7494_005936 [Penicillium glabrum]
MNDETWKPDWIEENRAAELNENRMEGILLPRTWSHTPARDMLNLQANEGSTFKGDLRLLFAASGDLGNVFTTIANLPQKYSGSIEFTINDVEFKIVARNIIILLIPLVVEDIDQAIDCIIHIWYSVMIRKSDIYVLQKRIAPIFATIQKEIKALDFAEGRILQKTFSFGSRSLKIGLSREAWNKLPDYLTAPTGLSTPSHAWRTDDVHRRMVLMPPARRLAYTKWLTDGLLLPYGHPHHDFTEHNPTLWLTADDWPAKSVFEPVRGWSPQVVDEIRNGGAENDIYGKLFFHLRQLLSNSLSRMSTMKNTIQILHMAPLDLPHQLNGTTFDRIDTSWLADPHWYGMKTVISYFNHLLPSKQANPHATMTCLLKTIVLIVVNEKNTGLTIPGLDSPGHKRLCKFAPESMDPLTGDDNDPKTMSLLAARILTLNYEPIFKLFARKKSFRKHGLNAGVEMKKKNTVLDAWPHGPTIPLGDEGDEHEFKLLMSENSPCPQRYVEWKKLDETWDAWCDYMLAGFFLRGPPCGGR